MGTRGIHCGHVLVCEDTAENASPQSTPSIDGRWYLDFNDEVHRLFNCKFYIHLRQTVPTFYNGLMYIKFLRLTLDPVAQVGWIPASNSEQGDGAGMAGGMAGGML